MRLIRTEFLSQILWTPVLVMFLLHWGAFYGLYYGIVSCKWQTCVLGYFLGSIGTLGGAHRYFSHHSFKAKWQLKAILMILQTLSGQKSIIIWAKEHRVHHKYNGTDGDVSNINRGFFFAHIGWILMKEHPECAQALKECNISDLLADPMIRFQHNYYIPLYLLINVLIPTLLPNILFNDSIVNGFFLTFLFRYVYTLHITFCGNSVAHYCGPKPYDKRMTATNNDTLKYFTMGASYHNYHHVFPFDYSANELGSNLKCNLITAVIDFFALIGWAYDLKRAPKQMIIKRKQRTGDTSYSEPTLHPIIDWTLGLTISSSPLWIIFLMRFTYQWFYSEF